MLDCLRRLAVDFEPRERLSKGPAVHQRPPGARRQPRVEQSSLQPQNLAESLHVATCSGSIPKDSRGSFEPGHPLRPRMTRLP